jgi:glutathione reductase (NADPH)
MWYAADARDRLKSIEGYTYPPADTTFNWGAYKERRDANIQNLRGAYQRNWDKDGVALHQGFAKFLKPTPNEPLALEITGKQGNKYKLTAKHIVVATGGRPTIPTNIPGADLGITSDGFFDLTEQPKRVAVVGAGYIAVELAGIFNALGTETHLLIRYDKVLRTFDPIIQDTLTEHMEFSGVKIHKKTKVTKVEGTKGGPLTIHTDSGEPFEVDTILWAVGRHANTEGLGLENVGVNVDSKGDVIVDEWQASNVKNIWAIGDVQGKALLTPVAIAAGRRLSNRLFGPEKFKEDKLSYEDIPTVVFSYVFFLLSFLKYLT